MKFLSIFIIAIGLSTGLMAQFPSDPGSAGIEVIDDTLFVGDTTLTELIISNYGSSPTAFCAAGDVQIVISFPVKNGFHELEPTLWVNGPVGSSTLPITSSYTGPYFTWTYDAANNVIQATNHTNIPFIGTEVLYFVTTGITPTLVKTNILVNVQTIVGSNNTANDNVFTSIKVDSVITAGLADYVLDVTTDNCAVYANITSNKESETSSLILQESSDGRVFRDIRSIELDNSELYRVPLDRYAGMYHYRLKHQNKSGNTDYTDVKAVNVNCNGHGVELVENPVRNNQLHIKGLVAGDQVRILDELGRVVYQHNADQNLNYIDLPSLNAAVYILNVNRDSQHIYSSKFVLE